MLIGRDFCREQGIILDFKESLIEWDESTLDMRVFPAREAYSLDDDHHLTVGEHLLHELLFSDYLDDEDIPSEKELETLASASTHLEANTYRKFDIPEIISGCSHLNKEQRDQLTQVLLKYPRLFSGHLREFKEYQVHLDLEPGALPHRKKNLFKDELDRLCKENVIEKSERAEWIAGTFMVPKRNGQIRTVTDFRGLNRHLRRRVYPMPKIADILSRRKGYSFISKLDLSMHYYHFVLDEESRALTTFATPHGLYRYKRLPQGLSQSPDIAQEAMDNLLHDLEDVEAYMDDIAAFSDSWQEHLQLLDKLLAKLNDKGFSINPEKCEWGVKETDFLGHWLTPEGIKPHRKKVEAVLAMKEPHDISTLRSFLGLVNWYRDMWPRRTHTLAPLTELTGKKSFIWGEDQKKAFREMKAICAKDAMLAYPDHSKPFHIETDASDYQLGAVIKQDDRPIAYYSRKLNSAQRNYTTIEKELLSIVETLKTFRNMLLGTDIHVYTDHKNLSHRMTNYVTQRVLRWRLLLEEYGPKFHYKSGPENVIADAFSRVPTTITEWKKSTTPVTESSSSILDDTLLMECFLEYPLYEDDEVKIPFHFSAIRTLQQRSQRLKDKLANDGNHYKLKQLGAQHHMLLRHCRGGLQDSPLRRNGA